MKLQLLRAQNAFHPLLASRKEIELTEYDLTNRLEKWRRLQAIHMSFVNPSSMSSELESSAIEFESLHLPSSFAHSSRTEMQLEDLAHEEQLLREGQMFECILQLRRSSKRLSALNDFKKKESKTQYEHTRANTQKKSIDLSQDTLLLIYNTSRQALIDLAGGAYETRFPPLSKADLFRKSTVHKRQVGDSHRTDGAIWVTGIPSQSSTLGATGFLMRRPSSSSSKASTSLGSTSHKVAARAEGNRADMAWENCGVRCSV